MNSKDCKEDYLKNGYTVFRNILPLSLIKDLRRESDKARKIARKENGPHAQRLQPVLEYRDQLEMKPFEDYRDLPELNEVIQDFFSPDHRYASLDRLGIFIEPEESAYCTGWHRDWRSHMEKAVFEEEFREDWDKNVLDINCMAQVNCPLYEDHCTWYVPGSHFRQKNTNAEEQVHDAYRELNYHGKGQLEREFICKRYAESMPKAVQLHLNPGDFALYKNCGWHMGNYVPYVKRATLHHSIGKGDCRAYYKDQANRLKLANEKYRDKDPENNAPRNFFKLLS